VTKQERLYTDRDLDDVTDNPEWTAEELARAKRIDDVDPGLAANIRRSLQSPTRAERTSTKPVANRKSVR
jgi:hypothetical protein